MPRVAMFDGIAGFRFVRVLGSGSFAQTYEAERDSARFAVKVLHELPACTRDQERFRREVLSLGISHPNLAEYVESGFGLYGGREVAYIAMRYVPGRSLRQRLAEHPRTAGGGAKLPWASVVQIGRGVCDGLACLHEHGVTHRDLKPANIYLTEAGDVVILDFGLAAIQDLTTITSRGAFVGTFAYCAPEQIRGEVDVQSDLYAVGAVLYEALTGQRPFTADNQLELIERVRHEDPEPPAALEPSVPTWLDDLIVALLAKEALQRPRGARAVGDMLRDPARHATRAVRAPYDRDSAPLLVTCTTTSSASRAVLDAALHGRGPDIALAAITQSSQLNDLHTARGHSGAPLAVDTRILDTATAGYHAVAALRDRPFLPTGTEPHTPESLRRTAELNRVARGDIAEQIREGADLLRATAFSFDGCQSPWLRRNPRLLEASLNARDALADRAPLYALLPCTIDALTHHHDRLSIVNRYARGEPDGYWIGIVDLEASTPHQIAGAVDFVLTLQQLGAPAVWTLPGTLAELAWSLGVAGVEVPLGRAGGFRLPVSARHARQTGRAPRFEFASLMTSLSADVAELALDGGTLPERACPCPSCQRASTTAEQVASADEHNLWHWLRIRDELAALDASQRVDRYRFRLQGAVRHLAVARKPVPELRSLRHLTHCQQVLDVVLRERILDTPARLRRAG